VKVETIIITKDHLEKFLTSVNFQDPTPPWEQLKHIVAQSHLADLVHAWKNCEDKDPSGLVTMPGLLKELGLV
jgi:hypothetical protein